MGFFFFFFRILISIPIFSSLANDVLGVSWLCQGLMSICWDLLILGNHKTSLFVKWLLSISLTVWLSRFCWRHSVGRFMQRRQISITYILPLEYKTLSFNFFEQAWIFDAAITRLNVLISSVDDRFETALSIFKLFLWFFIMLILERFYYSLLSREWERLTEIDLSIIATI